MGKPKTWVENCLTPECERAPVIRGLCRSCYECARKMVNVLRRTTWKELEERGYCKPLVPVHRGRAARFDPAAFLRKKRA